LACTLPLSRSAFARRLLVVVDHLPGEGLGRGIAVLKCELAGFDLEYVAHRGLLHEVPGLRRNAERGIDAGGFRRRLGESGGRDHEHGEGCGKFLHEGSPLEDPTSPTAACSIPQIDAAS
jgi:hypothetical protein